jgi:hypothetical protein
MLYRENKLRSRSTAQMTNDARPSQDVGVKGRVQINEEGLFYIGSTLQVKQPPSSNVTWLR